MFDEESFENEQKNETEQKPSTPAPDSGYEYVFSEGNTAEPKQKKKKLSSAKRNQGLMITGICLALVFCLLFFSALGVIAYQLIQSNSNLTSSTNNTPVRQNATVILQQVERADSEHGSAGDSVFAESTVVSMVHDTVVSIEATIIQRDYFRKYESTSQGSGVVISENGYILTCNHVINPDNYRASSILVRFNDGKEYSAVLIGADQTNDLAVIKIDAEGLTYAKYGHSSDLVLGEHIVVIGNPLGLLGGSVTSGIISATKRTVTTEDGTSMTLIQTDAAVNSGNSGGGLFNLSGELVGIVNAKYAATGVEGLAFAIPVDTALKVSQDLIEVGYVRGVVYAGLSLRDITDYDFSYYSENYYFCRNYGIRTAGLYVDSSEFCEDLKAGDRIISVNGVAVNTAEELRSYLRTNCKVGDTVSIAYERNGNSATASLTLREYVPSSLE